MSLRTLPEPLLFLSPTGSYDRNGRVEPTISGGVRVVPGQYGAAWQVAEATTNYVRNPRCAHDTTGWVTGSNREITRRDDLPTGVPVGVRTGLRVRATSTISGGFTGAETAITYSDAGDYTGSMYVYVPSSYSSGDLIVQLVVSGSSRSSLVDMSIRDEWQRVVTPAFEDVAAAATGSIQIAHLSGTWNADDEFFISCAQVEPKAYATPYCDGALGAGHEWTGTAHNSESTRQASYIWYALDTLSADRGSALFRFLMPEVLGSTSNTGLYLQSVGQISGNQNNLTVMYRPQIDRLTLRTGSGYSTSELAGPKPEPGTLVSVYLEWTPETIGVDWGFGNGLQTRERGTTGGGGWLGNGIWVGGAHQSFVGNTRTESALVFDRPLTDRERESLMGHPRAWSWYELTAPGLVTNVPRPRGVFSIQAELWRADRYGNLLERVPTRHPIQGTITHNDNTTVKKSLQLQVNEPCAFEGYRDFLVPILALTDATGNETRRRMGHYIALENDSIYSPARTNGTTQAKGIEHLLELSTVEDGLNVEAGTDPGDAARDIALDGGFVDEQLQLPATGFLLPNDLYIEPGQTRLSAINELYNAAGWYAIWSDGRGILRTGPWQDISTAQPTVRYSTVEGTLRIVGDLRGKPDMTRLRNVVTVRNIAPESEPIWYTARIENPNHPLHPERFGITLADTVDDPEVDSVEQAKQRAESLLSAGASFYRRVTVQTVADLDADAHELIELEVPGIHASELCFSEGNRWWRQGWTIELRGARAITTHELNRVEQYR